MSTEEKDEIELALAEGMAICAEYTDKLSKEKEFAEMDPQIKFEYFMKKHIDFARANPIFLRMIMLTKTFNKKAARTYMETIITNKPKTDEEWCEHQSEYVRSTYAADKSKRHSISYLNELKRATKSNLMAEMKQLAKEKKEIADHRQSVAESNKAKRREAIRNALIDK